MANPAAFFAKMLRMLAFSTGKNGHKCLLADLPPKSDRLIYCGGRAAEPPAIPLPCFRAAPVVVPVALRPGAARTI